MLRKGALGEGQRALSTSCGAGHVAQKGGTAERQVPSTHDPLLKQGPQRALIDVDGCRPFVPSSIIPSQAALNHYVPQYQSSSSSRAQAGWETVPKALSPSERQQRN